MQRWRIGDVEITRVVDVDLALPTERNVPGWAIPDFAPGPGEVRVAFSALAIRADGLRIVVDPWLANDGPRTRGDPMEHATRLLGALGTAGFPPGEVDLVVNTHLDGVGWNTRPGPDGWTPSFPAARVLYPAAEVAAIEAGADIEGREGFVELAAATPIERVEPPRQLTPSVSLRDAPGHNPGHLAVRIESGGDLATYPGHLVISLFQVDDPDDGTDDDPAHGSVGSSTRRAILDELADRRGLLLTTLLGGPGGGRVVRRGAGFALEP